MANIGRYQKKIKRVTKKSFYELIAIINSIIDKRKIYMDKSKNPFWKAYQTNPPVHYTSRARSRICHYINNVPKDNTKPFIVDVEHILMMGRKSRDYHHMINSVKAIEHELSSNDCKAIIVPTHGAIREIKKYFNNSDIIDKIRIIKPGYPDQRDRKKMHSKNDPLRILTIGNKFWGKGIPIAISIFEKLRHIHGTAIEMNLVSGDIPEDFPIPEGLRVINVPMLSKRVRAKLYRDADIFLFPCLHDSFGVYLESMAYGLPILSTDIYDKNELILDGETGFVIETPISLYDGNIGVDWKNWDEFQNVVKDNYYNGIFNEMIEKFVKKIELLMNEPVLLGNMERKSQEYQRENFNIDKRNREIRKIYNDILENI